MTKGWRERTIPIASYAMGNLQRQDPEALSLVDYGARSMHLIHPTSKLLLDYDTKKRYSQGIPCSI
jgi:hypothetical protein